MMEPQPVPPRSEAAREYTWNSESVFATTADWERELNSIQGELQRMGAYQGRLAEGPETLFDALDLRDRLLSRVNLVMMWAMMSHQVDKGDQAAAALVGQSRSLNGQAMAAAAFIEPEILALGAETLTSWQKLAPRLAQYSHYFDNLMRKKRHVRSAEVEELLGMLAEPFSGPSVTHGMLVDADLTFADATTGDGTSTAISQGNVMKIMASADRDLRRSTWNNRLDAYLMHKNSLTSNLAAANSQNFFLTKARGHSTTLEASLFENNIPVEVFHNLLEVFKNNLPTWRRYFSIRRKALGINRLAPYDMWAPLSKNRPIVSFPQAIDWICAGLAPLGEDYTAAIRRGALEDRWIDVYPNQGKFSGAFSYGSQGSYPFIVMSYTDEIFSLSTLAHELGHSMHSYLTWKTQPPIYADYSLFVAEVASNFHQAMVRAYLLNTNTERDFQIGLIEEAMANFYRYFLIMPTLARFELETHLRIERGQGLNAGVAIDLMADLFNEAYGDEVEVDRQRLGMWWSTFSHLYSDYYVFQYATGISAAHALSNRLLSGTPDAASNYLKFLSAGSSLYPIDALRLAGVDMSSPHPVEQTFSVLASYVDRLESFFS